MSCRGDSVMVKFFSMDIESASERRNLENLGGRTGGWWGSKIRSHV